MGERRRLPATRQAPPAGSRVEPVRPTGEVVVGGLPVGPADAEGLHILHADLDAFYASVEVLKDPSLRGRPLLVGGTGSRGVVTSASYQARAYGCRNAMPMAQARRLCPQAVAIPPDFATYRKYSKRVLQVFQSVTPLVEPLALDEAFLDVRGARRLLGPTVEIARALRARVREETGLALTVGVAGNKFLAKLASTRGKPDGLLVVPPSRALAFLHPLPAEALWGVGPAAVTTLARYGLRTVGEVARTPRETLERVLGAAAGAQIAALAQGRDDRPVVPFEAAKSVGSEETFASDLDDPERLTREVLRCAVRVGRRLRDSGLAGRTVTLKLRFADFRTITRSRTLAAASDDDTEIYEVARGLLARLRLGRVPVRLVGVSVSNLVRGGAPLQLRLGKEGAAWAAAARAADAVRARFGDHALDRASLAGEPPAEAFAEARDAPRPRRERLVEPEG
ncbi:MAG TPA: DNA polymerase IV [Actinomycetota bacterium]|jgi:DNA polymerase-4|nr:DNA polymerase IV [Actinomycetota bacterium]